MTVDMAMIGSYMGVMIGEHVTAVMCANQGMAFSGVLIMPVLLISHVNFVNLPQTTDDLSSHPTLMDSQ